jgi:hypothetical protein
MPTSSASLNTTFRTSNTKMKSIGEQESPCLVLSNRTDHLASRSPKHSWDELESINATHANHLGPKPLCIKGLHGIKFQHKGWRAPVVQVLNQWLNHFFCLDRIKT